MLVNLVNQLVNDENKKDPPWYAIRITDDSQEAWWVRLLNNSNSKKIAYYIFRSTITIYGVVRMAKDYGKRAFKIYFIIPHSAEISNNKKDPPTISADGFFVVDLF